MCLQQWKRAVQLIPAATMAYAAHGSGSKLPAEGCWSLYQAICLIWQEMLIDEMARRAAGNMESHKHLAYKDVGETDWGSCQRLHAVQGTDNQSSGCNGLNHTSAWWLKVIVCESLRISMVFRTLLHIVPPVEYVILCGYAMGSLHLLCATCLGMLPTTHSNHSMTFNSCSICSKRLGGA